MKTIRIFAREALLCTSAAAGLVGAQATHAQTATAPPSARSPATHRETAAPQLYAGGLEQVVVTAQKRRQNLQNVPIAVTALSSTQLARAGVQSVTDVKLAVPTLNVTDSAGYLTTSLRGIGSNGIGPGIENPIAFYIDGVYYGSAAASLLSLDNIAQIEVLKGPQGTLFGRNATGGLIQVSTRDPGATPTGNFNVGLASYDTYTANGYISGPINRFVSADLAVHISGQADGWGTNEYNGKSVYQVYYDDAYRSKWIIKPAEGTKVTVIADFESKKDSLEAYRDFPGTISGFPAARVNGVFPSEGYNTNTDAQPSTSTTSGGASVRLDQDAGPLRLTSISAYRQSTARFLFDYDGAPQKLESIDATQADRQFSEELQVAPQHTGRLTWLVGGYYYNAVSQYDPFTLYADDLGANVTIKNKQSTDSLAGYGQATYEVFPKTNITLGLRYTAEHRRTFDGTTSVFVIPLALALPPTPAVNQGATFDKLTYRLSVDHRFSDDLLGYVSYNRGFKSGGFNTSEPGSNPFRPETLDALEVGLKSNFLGNRIRANIAAFDYNYRDIQIQQLNAGAITIINGASAHVYGVDIDVTARVTDAFRLNGSAGLLDPEFSSFPNCPISTRLGGTPVVIGGCKGNLLPLASREVASLGGTYSWAVPSGTLDLSLNFYYNSGYAEESDNVIRQNSFVQLGADVRYTMNSGIYLDLFGRNLTDTRVINFETTLPNGTHTGFYQAPLTVGGSIGYAF